MKNLFLENEKRGGIFKREEVLQSDYAPSELLHRENELKGLADALKPLLSKSKPSNLFVFGLPGSGKTTSVRKVLADLQECSQNAFCAYINCWQSPSKQAIFSSLAEKLNEALPRRGLGSDEIANRVFGILNYERKFLVLVLDEVDRLFGKDEEDTLYEFARANENHKIPTAIVMITNNRELLAELDDRIRSSLGVLEEMEFRQYSPSELKDILRERARVALMEGSWSEEAIALCAAHGAKLKGDARVALETLYRAAKNAEKKGRNRIEVIDVHEALEKSREATLRKSVALMGETERKIVALLKEARDSGREISSPEIYEKLKNELEKEGKEMSERQMRNYLEELEKAGIIASEFSGRGTPKGKVKTFKLLK